MHLLTFSDGLTVTKFNINESRRQFMRQSLLGGAGAMAYGASGLQFSQAATQTPSSDYKALVCVFLFGGNDSFNMLHPLSGKARQEYQEVRGALARPKGLRISPIGQAIEGGLGFDISMPEMKTLFDQGHLAVQGNVGALTQPVMSKHGEELKQAARPKGLSSHAASQRNWMCGNQSFVDSKHLVNSQQAGWAGRVMDTLVGQCRSDSDFMRSISLAGENSWQEAVFHHAHELDITRDFASQAHHGDTVLPRGGLRNTYQRLIKGAVNNDQTLLNAIAALPEGNTSFPDTSLGQQLKAVSKLIAVGRNNGLKRQVFFVAMSGFDTHSQQAQQHPQLMTQLSTAMSGFYRSTEEMGIENNVTTFTMSDFGRKLRPNGDGTDHGWASHQFVLGGAVKGGRIYGDMPAQNQHTSLIPTTSHEQMFASLAKWYGIASNDVLGKVFPNLANFDTQVDYFTA